MSTGRRIEVAPGRVMKPEDILQQIADAGSWLPVTVARRAFTEHQAIGPALLEAVTNRAATPQERDIPKARLAAFGVFFLAQNRDRKLFEPLVRLFETMDQEVEDEWVFSGRLFFFGHRLLAGVCPHDPTRPLELVLNQNLKPLMDGHVLGSHSSQVAREGI
jgi:hypothetical protein